MGSTYGLGYCRVLKLLPARSLSRIQSTLQLLLFAPSHNQVLVSELNSSDAGARTPGFPPLCWSCVGLRMVLQRMPTFKKPFPRIAH
ncbi:hypothetical protein ACN38_g2171 [Penicillium nordicum]|uniref:Uncharacterized protein n=1 Tax=Penicillium nordicum TaxID=229535 RepID=A0A0M9WJ57_9EURO|nr:hypothetical protein ACN38_g2171 [Penicillium nordicum]